MLKHISVTACVMCTTWQACSWGDLAVNELENLSASEPASARRSASNARLKNVESITSTQYLLVANDFSTISTTA